MREQSNIPGVSQYSGRGADRKVPIRLDLRKGPRINKYGVHVCQQEQEDIGTGGDLQDAERVDALGCVLPDESGAGAELKQNQGNKQRFYNWCTIDVPENIHQRAVRTFAPESGEMVGQVHHEKGAHDQGSRDSVRESQAAQWNG